MKIAIEKLRFNEEGLLSVIVQDALTREVLTLAYHEQRKLGAHSDRG
ncbi:MAG: hypothetical protein WKF84_01080 [Pyrinomonadaceae bacterium]